MKKTLDEIRKYDTFIYDSFNINYLEENIEVIFHYEIKNLKKFNHKLIFPVRRKDIDKAYIEKLAFNIGMLELISYYKATVPKSIIVNCGSLNDEQNAFFKKIYFYGLGEFFYVNGLNPNYESFVTITSNGPKYDQVCNDVFSGNLIAVGGGKDSCVTLSLIPKEDSNVFVINPKDVMIDCAYARGYKSDEICTVKRIIDKELLALNEEGFLNGHTPFSAMVAFVSYLTAYLNGYQNIILSNESSANESNVSGTKINHQYSKSYEFEKDFQNYAKKYLNANINYFSFLRGLTEYQIGMLFSKFKEYHNIFKSCNVGSKEVPWKWCGECAKCLFVYSLLSPHLYKDELVNIFGKDLFTDESLLQTFKELLGYENVKPFDCVGTFEEINYAITKTIKNMDKDNLPILLDYYYKNYYDESVLNKNLEKYYNIENSLTEDFEKIIKGAISYDNKNS